MAKKKCGHEEVCIECTKAEIAKLEKRISDLKKKLPNDVNINIFEVLRNLKPVPYFPPLQPRKFEKPTVDHGGLCACPQCVTPVWC